MRYVLGTGLLVAVLVNVIMITPTFAISCSDRKGVCFAYCEKHHHNAPKCTGVCESIFASCMSTGCWESKITAKRCDISRQ